MGWFSDFFKPKKVEQKPSKESWQLGAGESLANWATQYLSQYQPGKPYGGKFTAPMAKGEEMGQDWLMKYLEKEGPGEGYGLAWDELQKTMTGKYDPFTSPFYQAMREGAGYQLEEDIDVMRRGQGARGTYFQDTSMREENKMRLRSTNYLMQLLGSLAETERGRRWEGVGKAMELEKYAEGLPLEKAEAGMRVGALPRLIEQADLESQYQDFLRKQQEFAGAIPAAQGVFATPMDYGVREWEAPSPFERIMTTMSPFLADVIAQTGGAPLFGGKSGVSGIAKGGKGGYFPGWNLAG